MTAYQRERGWPFCTRLLTFEEQCRYKVRSHEPIGASGDGRRFHSSTNVGVDRKAEQYMLPSGEGIVHVRTVMRLADGNKCDKDELARIKATPWSVPVPRDTDVGMKDKKEVEQADMSNCFRSTGTGARFWRWDKSR